MWLYLHTFAIKLPTFIKWGIDTLGISNHKIGRGDNCANKGLDFWKGANKVQTITLRTKNISPYN